MQALYLLALEPVAETTADPNSYGFRPARSTADAIEACFIALCKRDRAEWALEGDIKSCFDQISHEWLLAHIPMDKTILRKWLKAGSMENRRLYPTEEGTPQGSLCKALHNEPYAKWKTMQSKGKNSLKLLHCFPIYFA